MKTRSHTEELRKGKNSGQELRVRGKKLWVQRGESIEESTWGKQIFVTSDLENQTGWVPWVCITSKTGSWSFKFRWFSWEGESNWVITLKEDRRLWICNTEGTVWTTTGAKGREICLYWFWSALADFSVNKGHGGGYFPPLSSSINTEPPVESSFAQTPATWTTSSVPCSWVLLRTNLLQVCWPLL